MKSFNYFSHSRKSRFPEWFVSFEKRTFGEFVKKMIESKLVKVKFSMSLFMKMSNNILFIIEIKIPGTK